MTLRTCLACGTALLVLSGLVIGCGANPGFMPQSAATKSEMAAQPLYAERAPADGSGAAQDEAKRFAVAFDAGGQPQDPMSQNRRLIYEGEIRLVVDDFPTAADQLPQLVDRFGGFLANASVDRTQGQRPVGNWQVRLPADRLEDFIAALSDLGIPESRHQSTQDVTEEYIDLEARIANAQKLETRILELLTNHDGKIKDVIEVERELARVRGEIEQMQGRLRYLTNRTELATLNVVVREERDYVPPQAPTFAASVVNTWSDSLDELRQFGAAVALAGVYSTPWIGMFAVLLAPPAAWFVSRRWRRHSVATT